MPISYLLLIIIWEWWAESDINGSNKIDLLGLNSEDFDRSTCTHCKWAWARTHKFMAIILKDITLTYILFLKKPPSLSLFILQDLTKVFLPLEIFCFSCNLQGILLRFYVFVFLSLLLELLPYRNNVPASYIGLPSFSLELACSCFLLFW